MTQDNSHEVIIFMFPQVENIRASSHRYIFVARRAEKNSIYLLTREGSVEYHINLYGVAARSCNHRGNYSTRVSDPFRTTANVSEVLSLRLRDAPGITKRRR